MSKPIKIALLCLVGIPLIILSILISVFIFKDANDFKPTIEKQAKTKIGLNIKIEDDLSWSLIPIGIEVNKLTILDQDLAPFASAARIVVSIDFWSLFEGSPKVETIALDGLKLNLVQTSPTENNWSNILPPKAEHKEPEAEKNSDQTDEPNSLNFLVESFQLSNTHIQFKSIPQALELTIKPLTLSLTNITLGETFPLTLSYTLSEAKNQIDLSSTLKADFFVSEDLTQFSLSNIENTYEINAPQASSQTIKLNLTSDIAIDTKAESVDINALVVTLNNLVLNGQAKVRQYSQNLSINSNMNIPEFSLKSLLESLDISLPAMQNNEALSAASLSSDIKLENNVLELNELIINIDESQWLGNVSHALDSSGSKVRIKGNKLNLDNYLPPPNEAQKDKNVSEENLTTDATETTNSTLLPIETLQSLNLDIELQQDSIRAKNIETQEVLIALVAKNGKLTQTLSGKLFEGSYSSSSSINTTHKSPTWTSEQIVKDINLAPIFEGLNIEAIKEYGNIAGLLNLNAKTNMSGNDIDTLMSTATSKVGFHIDKGAFEGLSINALTCQGFALINKESVDTSTWAKSTPFNTLEGSASLTNQILDTQFDLITSGVHADSTGSIDISKSNVNILATLKVIGELGDNACRVNDKVKKVGIPIKCIGALDTPPAELCKLDASRLGDMVKALAVEEGKRKINKEVDRALDKHLGDKKEDVKSLLKNLLK